jgi:hypothetical protein
MARRLLSSRAALGLPLGDELLSDLVDQRRCLDLHLSAVTSGQQDRIGPRHDFVGGVSDGRLQLLGDTEHVAEHFDRQVPGDVADGRISARLQPPFRAPWPRSCERARQCRRRCAGSGRVNARLPARAPYRARLSMAKNDIAICRNTGGSTSNMTPYRDTNTSVFLLTSTMSAWRTTARSPARSGRVQRRFDRPLPADRALFT